MKMKYSKLVVAFAAMTSVTAMGAGFGLYEASARGLGMGNGLVGSTKDASANYYNPANLTELTNVSVMVGMTLINPFCDVEVNGVPQKKMNAGWFPPPHAYIAVPVLKDLVFGFGTYCEYGLGTKYDNDWALKMDTTETTIQQFTFNPNIAYKITDKWSVAAGARMSYITFENKKTPFDEDDYSVKVKNPYYQPGIPAYGPEFVDYSLGRQYIRTHLEGDDFSCGYVLATQYTVTDELSLGLVYRSRINHRIEGDMEAEYVDKSGQAASQNAPRNGDSKAKLILPASLTMGANYDFTEKFRGGASLTWTEWSTVDHIDFRLPTNYAGKDASYTEELNGRNAWRTGFGFEYDFTDCFTGRIGYTYDMDPANKKKGTTMLPSGDRHIIGFGASYRFLEDWRIDLGYSFIIMESETRKIHAGNAATGYGNYRFECDNSYSHLISASIAYTF